MPLASADALSIGNNGLALRDVKLALLVWKPVRDTGPTSVLSQINMDPQRRAAQLWLYLGSEINLNFLHQLLWLEIKETRTLTTCKSLHLCTRIKPYYFTYKPHTAAFACFGPLMSNHIHITADHFPNHSSVFRFPSFQAAVGFSNFSQRLETCYREKLHHSQHVVFVNSCCNQRYIRDLEPSSWFSSVSWCLGLPPKRWWFKPSRKESAQTGLGKI